jgi:drug/metabolite transporter (DMT)-like permease
MNERKKHLLRGVLCATLGGVCWGFSGTCGQYLFAHFEVDTMWLTCVRLLGGGGLLTVLALVRERDSLKGMLKSGRDCLQLLLYGIFGLTLCQYAYMTGIFYSNAATTTVLQNLGLVLIMLWTCLRSLRLPTRKEFIALLLALFGVFMLATGGNPSQMTISPQGLFWGLAAAVAVMLYTLLPRPLLAKWGRIAVTGLGMMVGGILLSLAVRVWTYPVSLAWNGWLAILATILLGSVMGFTLLMQGITDIGPVRASMLASTEPLSATILAVVWLNTTFAPTDFIGFAAIMATIFLLAKSE